MTSADAKHVFLSYVREDAEAVDGLCKVLEAAKIPYWRDRKDLGPGDMWRAKIREAIRSGSVVFIACFSESSRSKEKSYMNEELTLAVDEFRQLAPGRTWLIPARFDGGQLPYWDLGAGRSLDDLNYVDLFGAGHAAEAAKLVTTIHGLMGDRQMSPAAALESVERANAASRVELLKQLTKDMLVDPAKRIQLDDLVSQEVQRILAVINDESRVTGPTSVTNDQRVVSYAAAAHEMWELTKPFCASLQVAGRYGQPDGLAPWITGIRALAQAPLKHRSGDSVLLDLGLLPAMVSLMTAGMATASARQYDNLKALVRDVSVRSKYDSKPLPVLLAVDPFSPFDSQGWIANTLARASIEAQPFDESLAYFTERRGGKYRTPVAEWLHAVLRPLFADQWPDTDTYTAEFDRAEVFLGILAQDAAITNAAANPQGPGPGRSYWYGRSTWRAAHGRSNAVEDVKHELASSGDLWGPLRADLFGRDAKRARTAIESYQETFDRTANRYAF